jgi:hypothetical protein
MGTRLLVLIGMITVALTIGALQSIGFFSVVIGCLVAAVVTLLIDRNGNGPSVAITWVVLGVVAFVAVIVRQFRAMGWVTSLAIDLPVFALVVFAAWYLMAGRYSIAAARLGRGTARGLGWQYRKPDADLLRRVRLAFPKVPDRTGALWAAVDGNLDGVPMTFVGGRRTPQAWLVKLPFALPQITVRANDQELGGEPSYGQAMRTDAVARAMRETGVTEWRIERDDLVVVLPAAARADIVGRDAGRVATLARALPLTEVRGYAIDPRSLPDPRQWTEVQQARRHDRLMVAGVTVVLAVLVLTCGLVNVGQANHRALATVMLWVAGGMALLGALLWFSAPRIAAATGKTTGTG